MDKKIIENMREKYSMVHPLIFHRSVEYAFSPGDLFDILETIPKELPLAWDETKRRWVVVSDLSQSGKFEILGNNQ